jgi:hypothetical protein
MVFGLAGGIVYGIAGMSTKKMLYGMLGGAIGAGLGGIVFNPIAILTHGGAASRAVGFGLQCRGAVEGHPQDQPGVGVV